MCENKTGEPSSPLSPKVVDDVATTRCKTRVVVNGIRFYAICVWGMMWCGVATVWRPVARVWHHVA